MKKDYSSQLTAHSIIKKSGQILVIILLVMMVGLTVGLFLLGRTTVDISLTTKIADSSRAFNAAEAGIEEAIRGSVAEGIPVSFAPDVTYTVTTSNLGGSNGIYPSTKDNATQEGKSFTAWLVPHNDTDGTLITSPRYYYANYIDVCFDNNSANPTQPAIGVTVFYLDTSVSPAVPRSSYVGYDPYSTRRSSNFFITTEAALSPCPSTDYNYRARVYFNDRPGPLGYDFGPSANLTLSSVTLAALRVRPIYEGVSIAVVPAGGINGNLPKQGNDIISSGKALETTRRINVQEPYLEPAPFMDHAVYSLSTTTDLTHN